jgi:hypothetical protein
MGAHDYTDPNADLQMGILFVGKRSLLIEEFSCTPQNRGSDGKE